MSEVPDSQAEPSESISEEASSKPGMMSSLRAIEGSLVRIAGSVMVIAALMSWLEMWPDVRPNAAGVGPTTAGAGLVVLVVGLLLLSGSLRTAAAVGAALGAFTAAVIFIVRAETISDIDSSGGSSFAFPDVAVGAWLGVVSSAVALLGAVLNLKRAGTVSPRHLQLLPASTGAILTVLAPVLLTWGFGLHTRRTLGRSVALHADGLDPDIMTGYAIIILGSSSLLAVLVVLSTYMRRGTWKQGAVNFLEVASVAIVLLAGMEIAARLIGPLSPVSNVIWSGPIVALAGGIVMIRAMQPTQSA